MAKFRLRTAYTATLKNVYVCRLDTTFYFLPGITEISGLDHKRQWNVFLYENFHQHCKSRLAADLTSLEASLPKLTATIASQDDGIQLSQLYSTYLP